MTESVPLLPTIDISMDTEKSGVSQESIDQIMRIIYERRPELFTRLAQREHSSDASFNNDFSKEFHQYIYEELAKEIDVRKHGLQAAIKEEARRRARVMYGMSLLRVQEVPSPYKVIDDNTGAVFFDRYYIEKEAARRSDSPPAEHYIFALNVPAKKAGDEEMNIEFYAHKFYQQAEDIKYRRYGYEIDNDEFKDVLTPYIGNDSTRVWTQ